MKFQTRLTLKNSLLEQVNEVCLLGVILSDSLKWHSNTDHLIRNAYKRMTILRKLSNFNVPTKDLLHIYKLYVRSVLEQSSVVWSASITSDEMEAFERTQRISLKIVYKQDYKSYEFA